MSNLKVLIIPSWYPEDDNPFKGIFFKEQAEALNQYVDVAVLNVNTIQLNKPKDIFHKKKEHIYKENGLLTFKFNHVNLTPKLPFVYEKIFSKKVIESFERVLQEFGKPDIIHAHVSYPAGYAAMILSDKYSIPFMVTEHASFFENKLIGAYGNYTKKVLYNADYYAAVSSYLKKKVMNAGRCQCEIIPNFIEFEDFNSEIKYKNHYNFELIHIANRMKKVKGIDILLKALNRIIYEYGYSNIHLNLVGGGGLINKYEGFVDELQISEYCTFHGNMNHEGIVNLLKTSSILVISSRSETFNITGIEAMATGLPVVATRCGGPEDYINNNVGVLVENENVERLAEGIISMVDNYNMYDSEEIRNHIKNNYSKEIVCEHIISTYNKILYSS